MIQPMIKVFKIYINLFSSRSCGNWGKLLESFPSPGEVGGKSVVCFSTRFQQDINFHSFLD